MLNEHENLKDDDDGICADCGEDLLAWRVYAYGATRCPSCESRDLNARNIEALEDIAASLRVIAGIAPPIQETPARNSGASGAW